jgi:hypothetical protein
LKGSCAACTHSRNVYAKCTHISRKVHGNFTQISRTYAKFRTSKTLGLQLTAAWLTLGAM